MSAAEPGWYPDPSGRFVLRYYDGGTWTTHVTDAAGAVVQDTSPTPPPTPARSDVPTYGGPSTTVNERSGLRLAATIVAAAGFLAVLLCMVLDVEWFTSESAGIATSLSDIRDTDSHVGFDVFEGFVDAGWIVVCVLSALAVLGAWLRNAWRWVGLGAAIAGLAYTMAALGDVLDVFDELELGGGALGAILGLIAGIVGTAISRKPVT